MYVVQCKHQKFIAFVMDISRFSFSFFFSLFFSLVLSSVQFSIHSIYFSRCLLTKEYVCRHWIQVRASLFHGMHYYYYLYDRQDALKNKRDTHGQSVSEREFSSFFFLLDSCRHMNECRCLVEVHQCNHNKTFIKQQQQQQISSYIFGLNRFV